MSDIGSLAEDVLVQKLEKRGLSVKGSRLTLQRRYNKAKRAEAEQKRKQEHQDNDNNSGNHAARADGEGNHESESKRSKREYHVASTFAELSRTGTVVMKPFKDASPQLKKMAKTAKSRQELVMHEDGDLTAESQKGEEIMSILKARFRPIKNAVPGKPTHVWAEQRIKAEDIIELCTYASTLVLGDETLLRLSSPCIIFGDLHGNYRDLDGFRKAAWPLGIKLATSNVLFLGDYVDRGEHSIEVITYLAALKCMAPNKVFLLRGNHEDRDINGDEETYGVGSFHHKCVQAYGEEEGQEVWLAFNNLFDCMPLAAIVDEQVFCCHGGIPRQISSEPKRDVLEDIASIIRPCKVSGDLVTDILWSDPVHDDAERKALGSGKFPKMFGPNHRGPSCATFGEDAVRTFLEKTGCAYIVRAHEKYQCGFGADVNGKVLTVFSSSHYQNSNNQAGFVVVTDGKINAVLTKKE